MEEGDKINMWILAVCIIGMAAIILMTVFLGIRIMEYGEDNAFPKIKYKQFRQWYTMNPESWESGYKWNYIKKRTPNDVYYARVGFWDMFRLINFWEKLKAEKNKKESDKVLISIIEDVQKDIDAYRDQKISTSNIVFQRGVVVGESKIDRNKAAVTDMETLKPCPYCGGDVYMSGHEDNVLKTGRLYNITHMDINKCEIKNMVIEVGMAENPWEKWNHFCALHEWLK